MANISDVADADNAVQEALNDLHEADKSNEVYFATVAICRSITAFAIRMDYVLRDLSRGHDWPIPKRR